MREISRLNPIINSAEKADQRRDVYRVTGRRAEQRRTLPPVAGSVRLAPIACRTRYLATTIHALGPRPLHQLFCDLIVASSTTLPLLERYAALAPYADLIEAYGGRELSPNMRLIK